MAAEAIAGRFTYVHKESGVKLAFDVGELLEGRRFNLGISGEVKGKAVDGKAGVRVKSPLPVARLIKQSGGWEGLAGGYEGRAKLGDQTFPIDLDWRVVAVDVEAGTVVIQTDDDTEVTYAAKGGGGKCKDVVNAIGFGVGVIVTIGGVLRGGVGQIAIGAGMMAYYGGKLTGFMDPGEGNWEWGVNY